MGGWVGGWVKTIKKKKVEGESGKKRCVLMLLLCVGALCWGEVEERKVTLLAAPTLLSTTLAGKSAGQENTKGKAKGNKTRAKSSAV